MSLDMVMKNGDVAVPANPLRMQAELGKVQSVNDSSGTVPPSRTPNCFDFLVVQQVLEIVGAQGITTRKLMIFCEKSVIIKNVKTNTF